MPLIIPEGARLDRFRRINASLVEYRAKHDLRELAKAAMVATEDREFASQYRPKRKDGQLSNARDLSELLYAYLYFHLHKRDYVAAALILWSQEVFTPMPRCVQLIWGALFNERMIVAMGGGGLGKSYSPSAWMLLDYVSDPEWTRIQISSNTEDHLKKNLYGDMVRLHSEAALQLPGIVDSESISLDKKTGMGIFLLTIPGGAQSKGKIKGVHTKPRPEHPIFGKRSRVRAIIDEAQEVAQNIFSEIPNRFSTAMAGDVEHIKFIVCANPKDPYSPFGQNCKPAKGFDSITMADETWRSEKGWWIVSLNAMVHENVIARRTIYPGFVTYEGTQNWLTACSGDPEHADMYTYVYGKFPPQGTTHAIVSSKSIQKQQKEWIFDGPTDSFAFADWAFTGDLPTLCNARSGRAVGWTDYQGNRHDLEKPEMKIQLDVVGVMARGDTQDLADEAMGRLKPLNVRPHHFGDDRTGVGQGPHDIVRRQWRQKIGPFELDDLDKALVSEADGYDTSGTAAPIYGIHFGQDATRNRVAEEDSVLPIDMYDGIRSEVWYVFSRLLELDVVAIGKLIDPTTLQELAARRGSRPIGKGKKLAVEAKDIYRARTGSPSPDRADSVVGVVHIARVATRNLLAKARDTESTDVPPQEQSLALESWGSVDMPGLDGADALSLKD